MFALLLRKGYFPQELPPLFSTVIFANCIKKNINNLPESVNLNKPKWSSLAHHNLAQVGGLRRRLSIPNPISFIRLARKFDSHANELNEIWTKSPYSQTIPKIKNRHHRAIATFPSNRSIPMTKSRVGARYLLKADISQFYSSIYTHTISWALYTKEIAKVKKNDLSLLGNSLDEDLRAAQKGQSKGIPIGPDTSLGIAELLLTQVDTEMKNSCNIIGGVRFVDDIEFTFRNLGDAENALFRLEAILHSYELQLNMKKTKIINLPDYISEIHTSKLSLHIPKPGCTKISEWINYFNLAFELAREFPSRGVLRYTLGAIKNIKVELKLWASVQLLLWQTIIADPGCLRYVIDILWENSRKNPSLKIDKDIAEQALNSLIMSSAPVGHGSEIVWSLWASLLFELTISEEAQKLIEQMNDSFVAIATMVASEHGVFSQEITSTLWLKWIEEGDFWGENWLFLYEAYRKGWRSSATSSNKIERHHECKFMKEAGVSFLDENIVKEYKPYDDNGTFYNNW